MKVYWQQNYDGPARGQLPGQEMRMNKLFEWAGEKWLIPAVYACGQGLVADICRPVENARMQAFIQKWDLLRKSDEADFTKAQLMELAREHPLEKRFSLRAQVNGRALRDAGGCGFSYIPELSKGDPEAKMLMEYYGLDFTCAWAFWRQSFAWATKRKPRISRMELAFSHDREEIPGEQFAAWPGKEVHLLHPVTGQSHLLRVTDMKDLQVQADMYVKRLQYELVPALPRVEFTVKDVSEGESRMYRPSSVVGIIGSGKGQAACSSVYRQPPEQVVWQAVFRIKAYEDVSIQLL